MIGRQMPDLPGCDFMAVGIMKTNRFPHELFGGKIGAMARTHPSTSAASKRPVPYLASNSASVQPSSGPCSVALRSRSTCSREGKALQMNQSVIESSSSPLSNTP